jgi:uncharacterized SAM-binding protein YcdF (DUF218 family)
MFFVLSKILGFFAIPSNTLLVIGLIGGVLLFTRRWRLGRACVIVSLLLFAILGWSPLGNILILPLEERFPPWDAARGAPDGIIVLGGTVSPDISAARREPALHEAAERVTAVAVLARRFPAARIVYTGGSGSLIFSSAVEADFVLPLFESFGIGREQVLLERRSRNTVENARFTKELVQPKPGERWLLITSAYHMPRSIGVFRRQGFPVEAYPVDWRTQGRADAFIPFPSVSGGILRADTAVHEWAGIAAYWLTGQTSELFPGP